MAAPPKGYDAWGVIDLEAWRGPLRGGEEAIESYGFTPAARTGDTIQL